MTATTNARRVLESTSLAPSKSPLSSNVFTEGAFGISGVISRSASELSPKKNLALVVLVEAEHARRTRGRGKGFRPASAREPRRRSEAKREERPRQVASASRTVRLASTHAGGSRRRKAPRSRRPRTPPPRRRRVAVGRASHLGFGTWVRRHSPWYGVTHYMPFRAGTPRRTRKPSF